ncbi:pseudouridine synthase [Clostridiaceae bacterium DONG20-135]|uniref:Pseudouridine synthase n=2 Tax=Copranaerobaculum intestinale TaxID=2692629 RepID=A0A6N8UB10_9FIRM|nr:pseudouridine synthase [Copranaerobaculum intestinale]
MRIEKYIANSGLFTRNEVKKMIRAKRIQVNGEIVLKAGLNIQEDRDEIRIDDEILQYDPQVYIMLNKPRDVISATQDTLHETVMDLIDDILPPDCFPIGRLDIDTEGLLLISNDGALAHRLLSPRHHVAKTYEVHVREELTEAAIKRIQAGILIDQGEQCLPAKIEQLKETVYLLTIEEGKYHQVKRMMQAVDNEVLYLKRLTMGSLTLDESLDAGAWRYLDEAELTALKQI